MVQVVERGACRCSTTTNKEDLPCSQQQTFSCQENVVQLCISLRQEDAAALLALLRSALPGMRDAARGSAARQVIRERV